MKIQQRKSHARIWTVLSVLLPILVILAILTRQDGPQELSAVPLDDTAKEFHANEGRSN